MKWSHDENFHLLRISPSPKKEKTIIVDYLTDEFHKQISCKIKKGQMEIPLPQDFNGKETLVKIQDVYWQ